jgi:zinc protease
LGRTRTLKNEPISERELQKLKNKMESQQTFSDASALNKAMNLAFYELMGNVQLINTEIEHYNAVTAGDIQRVASQIFRKENSSVLYYRAKKAE